MAKEQNSFEATLSELEAVVRKLESGDLSLDESLKSFENGVKLYKSCKSHLDKAQKKLSKLTDSLKEENLG